ncbi:MAG: methylated-DNA--[protein]-cysteine S-methyltransferase [Holosporales bacterium]|jgi:O-6-methylguanine DNA methyltransferase|nr:methylated-DNA--[protein]-cysteine S-methyltransferase [Holosporales bacterium]
MMFSKNPEQCTTELRFIPREERPQSVPLLGKCFPSPFGSLCGLFEEERLIALALVGEVDHNAVTQVWTRSFGAFSWKISAETQEDLRRTSVWIAYGTLFQQHVWKTLRTVPFGQQLSYSQLACKAGCPKAVRAVASAVASNPLALILPCHRVVAQSGLGGYRWGLCTKERLLAWERTHDAKDSYPCCW